MKSRQLGPITPKPPILSRNTLLSRIRNAKRACDPFLLVTQEAPLQDYDREVNLTIDLDREEDGRWIADRIAHQELPSSALHVSFTIPDEQLARQ